MSKFINMILKEAEDDSDDFFKMKLSDERREKYLKAKLKFRTLLSDFENGEIKIKSARKHRTWNELQEELFLKLFSNLHLNKKIAATNNYVFSDIFDFYDDNNVIMCFYKTSKDHFIIDKSIWNQFNKRFNIDDHHTKLFMNEMITKYFKLKTATCLKW